MEAEVLFASEREAIAALKAVEPDNRKSFKRSVSSLNRRGNALRLKISSTDLTAMRASFNSVMKCVAVSGEIMEKFGK